jgi:hypothetical protein
MCTWPVARCVTIHNSKRIDIDEVRIIVPSMSNRDSSPAGSPLLFGALLLLSFAAGCSSGQSTGSASMSDDGGGLSGGSSSSGAGSTSSGGTGNASSGGGGTSSGSDASSGGTSPSSAYADGGISCGFGGGCAPSEACCYAAMAGGGFGAPAAPQCTAPGSCSGSELDCTSTMHCSGSQVCCFAFATSDAGAGGGFPGAAAGFGAKCASSCPTGDMVHYQLCVSTSECPGGESCIMGQYTTYCAQIPGPDGGNTGAEASAGAQDGGDQ